MRFALICALLWVATFCTSCTSKQAIESPTVEPETPIVVENPVQEDGAVDCTMKPVTVSLRTGSVSLPATGAFIVESHYATQGETFPKNRGLFPSYSNEKIQEHLNASCKLLVSRGLGCPAYSKQWEKVWTPAENGLVGQAARGDQRPTLWQELWQGNLYYKTMPKAGTKYLVTNKKNGKQIVASFGYEIGPMPKNGFGGLTVEAMWYLQAVNGNQLTIGELADQSADYGPVKCKGSN